MNIEENKQMVKELNTLIIHCDKLISEEINPITKEIFNSKI